MRRIITSFVITSLVITLAAILPYTVSAYDYSVHEVNLTNYVGNNQNIHPKVLYFEDGWNGYKFWMAYTPYPYGIPTHENPCIAVSNDGINWMLPNGAPNPLASTPSDGYNSDTHLVYREDQNRLECWYRAYTDPLTMDCIMMCSTKDGKNWSSPVEVCPWNGIFRLSPAVHCADNRYVMYYVIGCKAYLMRSGANFDYSEWSEAVKINLGDDDPLVWHLDVVPGEDGWNEIVYQDLGVTGNSNNFSSLWYVRYNHIDNISADRVKILVPDGNDNSAMGQGIYRSSLVNVGNEQYVYASSLAKDQTRHMTVFYGKDLISKMGEYVKSDVNEINYGDECNLKILDRVISNDCGLSLTVYDGSGRKIGVGPSVLVGCPGLYLVSCGSKTHKVIIQ